MDRKRFQKIIKYVVVYFAYSLLLSLCLYAQINYERRAEQQRMLMLLEGHPEWEAEIIALWYKPEDSHVAAGTAYEERFADILQWIEDQYGHDLLCILPEKKFVIFWAAGMLVGAMLTILLGYREKQEDFEADELYQELCECLGQFQRGNFRQIPEYNDISEAQMKLWETVRELGVYFDSLKKRVEEEEDSTKALITDISHQLKTPLASLRMSYELVTGDHVTEEEKKEFLEQEAKEIEKLEMLLAELVNLSRLEKHMIQIKPMPSSLKGTITDAVSRVYLKARNKDIEIQVEMEQDLEICHDGKWTVEALVNILDNAVKYSGEHTTITVRVQPLVKNVLIEVEDEGIGIESEDLPRIYQRFYRGKKAKAQVEEGAGVGLYLSRMILERQGGTIIAKGRMGRGTIFKVTLPC